MTMRGRTGEPVPDGSKMGEGLSRRRNLRNRAVADALARHLPAGRVCDVGTGTGELARLLRERGYAVEAVDIDPSRCQFPDLHVQQCDVMAGLPFGDEAFDALVATELVEHMEDPYKAAREFNRVLKPDGLLVLTTPNYGHIESRIGYTFSGCLPHPLPCRLEPPRSGKAHAHIGPMSMMRLKYLLANTGFEPVHVTTCIPKRRAWPLLPAAVAVWLVTHMFWSESRRSRYHIADQMKVILGGRSLIVVSRKRLGAERSADTPARLT